MNINFNTNSLCDKLKSVCIYYKNTNKYIPNQTYKKYCKLRLIFVSYSIFLPGKHNDHKKYVFNQMTIFFSNKCYKNKIYDSIKFDIFKA